MSDFTINTDKVRSILSVNGLIPIIELILNTVLQAEATEQIGADPHERSESRLTYRNGYRERIIITPSGKIKLNIPKFRNGTFTTEVIESYQRCDQALIACIIEMYFMGVSTRKVTEVVETLCGHSVSKSFVSHIVKRVDPEIEAWRKRDLSEKAYPFIMADAIVTRVRESGQVRQKSVLIVSGINEDGIREILGFITGDKESETSWSECFNDLKERGLRGVEYVISDSHKGLVNAIKTHLQSAVWQRCQAHMTRNIMDVTPKNIKQELAHDLRLLFNSDNPVDARKRFNDILTTYGDKAAKAMDCLENGYDDCTAVLSLPSYYQKKLRTTNCQERMNRELRRRERAISIFPNLASLERVMGALLIQIHEEGFSCNRFFNMDEFKAFKNKTVEESIS